MDNGKLKTFSKILLLGAAGSALTCHLAWGQSKIETTTKKPNVLFILTDNQPASMIGCYGNVEIKTPKIDGLAKEGIQFVQTFAVNGLSSPTRATLMTALLPSQHGIHDWLDDRVVSQWPNDWCAVREFRTLPITLKDHGYQTAMIGKYHLGQPRQPMPGFDYWLTFIYGHTIDFWHNTIIDNGQEYQVNDWHICDFFAEKAVEYIRKYDGKQPFYLQLNFDGPYLLPPTNLGPERNRFYPEYVGKDFHSYPRTRINEQLLLEIYGPDNPNDFYLHTLYDILRMHQDPESMANMASQNSLVDDGVGRVLAALYESGLDNDTLVIFSTDQADLYGQHGLYGHTNYVFPAHLYDDAMHIPFIVRHIGTIAPGQVSDLMIGQYDIMPTILDYVGLGDIEIKNSPGKSFAPYLRGQKLENWDDDVYFENAESRGIRNRKFSYWKRLEKTGSPELYDLEKDPQQNQNVYSDLAYEGVISILDRKLTDFFNTYADPEYNLWKGGSPKGSLVRIKEFKQIYGEDWKPITEEKPLFSEE